MRSTLILFLLFVSGAALSLGPSARSDDVVTIVVKKQEEKQKVRWTLSSWLDTRDKMRMQDLWLALHSPSPYEFFLDLNFQLAGASPGGGYEAWELGFAAFATIFGLEGRFESGRRQVSLGMFDLRVFGYHDQSTNLTLQMGVRNVVSQGVGAVGMVAGARMNLYFAKPFGIEALYRYYFPSTPGPGGVSSSGNRFQGGAFLEFKALRLYADYFNETETALSSEGLIMGSKIYF